MLIPLPFLTVIVALAIAARIATLHFLPKQSRIFLSIVFLIFTAESVLTGVRFGYGYTDLITVQRLLPFFVGPFCWLGFQALTRQITTLPAIAHISSGIIGSFAALTIISTGRFDLIEPLITTSYLVYIALHIRLWRQGADVYTLASLSRATQLRQWLGGMILLLTFILILDGSIAIAFYIGRGDLAGAIIFAGSAPLLAAILIFAVFKLTISDRPSPQTTSPDLIARIEALMVETQLYRESDLTLARLATRLSTSARDVSRTINAATGNNVSQYINKWRVEHAAELLVTTDLKVEAVSHDSGFLTRSNFYREFQRIHNQTPASYRRAMRTS
ncbi:MAG: helix-turn-helix domain-containing protein [Pikeienuella sp.]